MDPSWCINVLKKVIGKHDASEIFNTDKGSKFSSSLFTDVLKAESIRISTDGKGRAIENIFIEQLWKSEYAYLNRAYGRIELYHGMKKYMEFYNNQRPHQSLKYQVSHSL
ncbi:integrase core domain-containing protein [Reichenbachiella faecimaris]|uniref:integrase core domain-containing protein n=1 Tax=Reichenbachiella faecimaris TaxID=692418 RepID=UPI00111C15A4|nr:integrase core domain-containing protein [Reichenbachiella faecimaris]